MLNKSSAILLILLLSALGAGHALADDADPFAGLIAGTPVTDEELETVTGRGFELGFGGGVNNGTATQDVSSTVTGGAFGGARGIMQITQFSGDGNTVPITVNIEVNINTTTITNSSGLSVGVANNLNLSGGSSGVGIGAP